MILASTFSSGALAGMLIGVIIGAIIIGIIIGFFITRAMVRKQIKDNPPVTEKQIRAMYMSMGRKPSEADIKRTMRSMQQAKK
ncbi:YneF family protein [Mesoplasma corruscae]|uniref:Uncharacterized protein n=1 Tax=Mesoplasma corruscae TaxID=216874 RepID=A0A2S5RG98_9MOLU|nr:YneF family protein [Mesoplasma corruscae]PPE06321.1 hypothetical protein MCORR_v1c06260 [Mesoplasma corruscae]